ncbi:MAG: hypothetical protein H5U40_18240, partial [Polyangiaceae bacterium]|nr:hypothetical protein [Polyangiaceae bacterium]
SPASLEVIDVWAEQLILPALSVRVGQFRVPFTRHRQMSYANLALVDWDAASIRFGAERQLGMMVHNGAPSDSRIHYNVGVFTGVNARAAFARGMAETYGEVLPNPSNLRSPAPAPELHPELVANVGYATRAMDVSTQTDAEGGPPRIYVGLSAAWDAQPDLGLDFAMRIAPEALIKLHHLTIDAVGYLGISERSDGGHSAGSLGANVDVAYRFHRRAEVAARYSRVDTLEELRDDARARAEAIVAAADPAAQPALLARYADAGRVRNRQEAAVGLNVMMIGRSLAWQSDFGLVHTERTGSDTDEDELRLRSQLQLVF